MEQYRYEGPVKEFDKIISDKWVAETRAVSEAKAKSNLIFRFKAHTGRAANSKISLPGKLVIVERSYI